MVQLDGKLQTAWKILSPRQMPFCQGGDSGSMILNSKGHLQGLLFAGLDEKYGLMLPIDVLEQDVKLMTGGTLSV